MKRATSIKRTPFQRVGILAQSSTDRLKKQRTRKCAICRTPFEPRSMTHKVCSGPCGITLAQREREARERKETRVRKAALKTRSDWMKEAQQSFNAYRREVCRIAGYGCIDCGRPLDWTGNNVDAGHYRSVGSAPHVRFIENNVWAQAKQCNRYGAGRAVDYRIGLIARIGLPAVEALEADNTPRKHSIDELRAIRDEYRAKLRTLKASQP